MLLLRTFLVVLVLALSLPCHAATRYVSTAGSDSNSCATSTAAGASAKRNLNGASGAIACMNSGDTLLVQNGTYNEQISDTVDSEHPGATPPPSGTSTSARTVIKSQNFRGATLNKPNISPANHVVFLGQRSYVSIEDLVLDGRGHASACVWIGPGNGHKLQGNYITNCGGNGIYGSVDDSELNGENFEILDNEIVNVAQEETPGVGPGTHAIYNVGKNGRMAGNYIHGECPFNGFQVSSEHGGVFGNIIENNRVVGCGQAGILNQGSNTIVRNNLLEGNGIGIQCNGSNTQQVYNNTIYGWLNSASNGDDSYGILDLSNGCDIQNNVILQQRDVESARRYIYSTGGLYVANNLCDGAFAQNCQINVADYTTVVINGPGGNLQLVSTGAAVNAGANLSGDVPVDRLGVARPQGGAFDIGAYEFTAGGDTTDPTVSITAPVNTATVSGTTVSVTATASDNVGVVGVQFKLDGVNLQSEDTSSPYGITWDTTSTTDGTHGLTAVARDAAGNDTISATITVTVLNTSADTTNPTVYIDIPTNGATVNGTAFYVRAQASDNVGVVGVQFKLDGVNLSGENSAAPWNVYWDTTTATTGAHVLTAVARDAAGNTTTSSAIAVTANNGDVTAPTVALTAPANAATVSGAITVSATASDNVGVVGVQFKLDGANLQGEDTSSPYAISWDTTTTTNGSHALTAVARDGAGNTTTSSTRNVTVSNGTLSFLQEVTNLSISAASTITFLGEVTGLSVVSP